ncbi:MAG: bifunctional DNA-formamidopyrimidine glycosylase/DNA-(apurinic or apyrimidinic site) lyase [Planctomycetaceae bacterium]
MPELPEVETMVRGIREHVEGCTITQLRKCRCSCRPIMVRPNLRNLQARCRGATVVGVTRFAKRVVIELGNGDRIAIEPRMTGLMLLADPPSRGHLRFEWVLERESEPTDSLWFWDRRGLGTVSIYTAEEYETELLGGRFGPDALEMTLDDWKVVRERTTRPIKVALLDQKLVAGIGNLYASEILHLCKIPPDTPARDLTTAELKRIAKHTLAVLQKAIRYEGSTLGDGTYRNALNKDGGYQNEHLVYARAGQACKSCKNGTIERIVQAQRSTFFCPLCQRSRAANR